ncbi:MAG: 50S ribosomal protein L23 [Candidatus Levyibacteriota bacterium]
MKQILIRPVITEKSMKNVAQNKFTFIVNKAAKKNEVKKAIEKQFDVHVVSVATIKVKGRSSRTGMRRIEVAKEPWKKAVVELKSGEKIGLFETA